MPPFVAPPRAALTAAEGAILVVLLAHAWILWRALRERARTPWSARVSYLPLVLALLFALPAAIVARSGALAPGVSGAGMPWESVTDRTPYALAARAGERAYLNRCAPCHLPTGQGLPPAYPALAGSPVLFGPAADHARIALFGSPAVLARFGAHRATARMPGFAGAASDAELSVILTYERSAFGGAALAADSARAHVRPADVAAAREDGL